MSWWHVCSDSRDVFGKKCYTDKYSDVKLYNMINVRQGMLYRRYRRAMSTSHGLCYCRVPCAPTIAADRLRELACKNGSAEHATGICLFGLDLYRLPV
jgi:hypothetical protein